MATKCMGTKDVRIDQKLNKFIWSCGIRNLPRRVRVRFQRKRNDDENAKEKMYTIVAHIPCERDAFKGMQTEVVVDDA
jgi:large subunit ribosomal protein L31e